MKTGGLKVATLTSPVSISIENENNPWLAAAARFDEAAMRLKLDDGMRKGTDLFPKPVPEPPEDLPPLPPISTPGEER